MQPPLYTLIVTYLLRDKLLPCIEGDSTEPADFDTYTTDFDTQVIYSLCKISKRDNAGVGKLPERGIAGASELP